MTEIAWGGSFSDRDREGVMAAMATLGIGDARVRMVTTCVGPEHNCVVITDSELIQIFVPKRRKHRSEASAIVGRFPLENLSQVAYKSRHTRGDDTTPRRLYALEVNGSVSELGLLIPGSSVLVNLAVALDPLPFSVDGERLQVPFDKSEAPKEPSSALFAPIQRPSPQSPGRVTEPVSPDRLMFFVSHATEDGQAAGDVVTELQSQGVDTWLATRDIQVGENYAAQIHDAIVTSSHLVVLLSSASIASAHVQREVNLALDQGKSLLPVVLSQDPGFMATLTPQWRYWLGVVQVVPYSGAVDAVGVLLRSIGFKA